jgi:hypothetical protein
MKNNFRPPYFISLLLLLSTLPLTGCESSNEENTPKFVGNWHLVKSDSRYEDRYTDDSGLNSSTYISVSKDKIYFVGRGCSDRYVINLSPKRNGIYEAITDTTKESGTQISFNVDGSQLELTFLEEPPIWWLYRLTGYSRATPNSVTPPKQLSEPTFTFRSFETLDGVDPECGVLKALSNNNSEGSTSRSSGESDQSSSAENTSKYSDISGEWDLVKADSRYSDRYSNTDNLKSNAYLSIKEGGMLFFGRSCDDKYNIKLRQKGGTDYVALTGTNNSFETPISLNTKGDNLEMTFLEKPPTGWLHRLTGYKGGPDSGPGPSQISNPTFTFQSFDTIQDSEPRCGEID